MKRRLVGTTLIGLLLATFGCSTALAEPYSGGAMDDPLVRAVSWAILLLGCLAAALVVAIVISRGDWRSRRFGLALCLAFLAIFGLARVVDAIGAISQIVSLVLHLIL